MSYFSTQFAKPEPSPWKSQWLLDFEQYMKEQAEKKRAVKPAISRTVKAPTDGRQCERCENFLKPSNKTGLCRIHRGYKRVLKDHATCELCPTPIQRNNKSGRCLQHRYKGKLFICVSCTNRVKIAGATCRPCVRKQNARRTCTHSDCNEKLNSR